MAATPNTIVTPVTNVPLADVTNNPLNRPTTVVNNPNPKTNAEIVAEDFAYKAAPSVITADKAAIDIANKQNFLKTTEQQIKDQAALNLQTKAQQAQADLLKQQSDAANALKQQEIDAKNKLGADINNLVNIDTSAEEQFQAQHPGQISDPVAAAALEAKRKANNKTTSATDDYLNQQKTILKQQEDAFNQYKADMDSLANGTFPLTPLQKTQIAEVQKRFDQLKKTQQLANQNYEGGLTQLGITSGRARYAAEMELGNIQGAINSGIQKVAEIESQAVSAVNDLKSAFEEKNYKRIGETYDKLETFLKNKSTAIKEMKDTINEEADRQQKKIMDAQQTRMNELTMQKTQNDLLKNNLDMYASSLVSIGEDGNVNMTSQEEVDKLAAQLGIDPGLLYSSMQQKAYEYSKMSQEDRLRDIQINEAKQRLLPAIFQGYEEAVKQGLWDPKNGDALAFYAATEGAKTGSTLLSPEEAAKLKVPYGTTKAEAAKMGITPSSTSSSGLNSLSSEQAKAYRSALSAIKFGSVADRTTAENAIADAINNGDTNGAKDLIRSYVIMNSTSKEREVLDGKRNAMEALNSIETKLNEFKAAGGNTNIFTGLSEKALEKGGLTKDPKLANLANSIAIAIIDYRKAITGAAFTESEGEAYEQVFPSVGNTTELNTEKISTLKESLTRNQDNFIKSRLGETNYNRILGNPYQSVNDFLTNSTQTERAEFSAMRNAAPKGTTPQEIYDTWVESKGFIDLKKTNVDSDTNQAVVQKVSSIPDNTKGGQCGSFVYKQTGLRVGDNYSEKLAQMDQSIKQPKPGMVFVMPVQGSKYGHIGLIIAVNGDKAVVKDSNWDNDEKVKTHTIPISQMTGFNYV